MDHVSIDAAEALSGEEAFILQLRPPAPPGADETALAERVDQFARLYLTAAEPVGARFARLAPLTWAIAASRFDAARIEAMRADLCEILFGADTPEHVQIARQPLEPEAGNFAGQPSAAGRAAYDDDSETFDIDIAMLDIDDSDVFEVDSWRPSARCAASIAPAPDDEWLDEARPAPHEADETQDWDGPTEIDSDTPQDSSMDTEPEADVLSALAELERAFQADMAGDDVDARDEAGDWMTEDASEPLAGGPDDDAAFDTHRFEADLDAFEALARGEANRVEPEAESAWEPAAREAPSGDRFDSMIEAPTPRGVDLAAELSAFRREMRAIAEAIPGAGGGDALAHFREEVEAVAGALGQRVDGAAQRIEAAAERIAASAPSEAAVRLDGAAERAERSALLMESSVQEAVRALKAVLDAANTPGVEAING